MKKILSAATLIGFSVFALAQSAPAEDSAIAVTTIPLVAAAADSLSTYLTVSSGLASEANPLVNVSPIGLVALFGAKTWLLHEINTLEPVKRNPALQNMSGLWSGISINNLMLLLGSAGPQAIIGGIAGGIAAYHWEAQLIEAEAARMVPAVAVQNGE